MRLWKSKICVALTRTWNITCSWSWVARSSGGTLSGRHIYNLFLFLFRFWDCWRSVKQQKLIPKRRESTSYHYWSKYNGKVACTHSVFCLPSCHLNIWSSDYSPQLHPNFPSCQLNMINWSFTSKEKIIFENTFARRSRIAFRVAFFSRGNLTHCFHKDVSAWAKTFLLSTWSVASWCFCISTIYRL